ncbi:MAG: DNA polymerase, partial [Thermomicrobiales bacterium]
MTVTTGNGRNTSDGRRRLVLVDGYGLAFRAFHALPMSMSTAAGEMTNATFGFASMLLDVLRAHQPDCVLITFDVGKSFRHDQFADYKAHRAPMAEEMRGQMQRIRELIATLNIPIYEADGFEADDVIGTLANQAADQGMLALVVTGDSDLLQLVNENIHAVLPGAQRFGEYRLFDRQAVIDRYGFGPERLAEYKALVGDKSDNIPGVPGIGEKTAKDLIKKYPSIEEIIAHVDEITPTRARNALAENAALAYQCRELATIVTNVPVELEIDRCTVGDFDREKVIDLFRLLEFRSLVNKLPDSDRAPAEAYIAASSQQAEPVTVRDRAGLETLAKEIRSAKAIALDVETDGTSPIISTLVGIAIATSENRAFYIPVMHASEPVADSDQVREIVGPALAAHKNVITHHGKFDLALMQRHGFNGIRISFDTMLAAYLLGETGIGLKDLAFRYLGWEMKPITDLIGTGRAQTTMDNVAIDAATTYAGADVEATLRLLPILKPQLIEREQMSLLEDIELALVPILIEMEMAGIAIDTSVLESIDGDVSRQIAEREREIYDAVGHEFNIASTKQLGEVLFEELKLPTGRKTKTGYSVGQEVLDGLRGAHPAVDAILSHRTLKKLKSTYIDALPLQVNPTTGRIHTNYNQTI